MAQRPLFIPTESGSELVKTLIVEFEWFPGMSIAQKRRSIASLHESSRRFSEVNKILEISSKSPEKIGIKLSAFNLIFKNIGLPGACCVESLYQGSKIFEKGGPFTDLFTKAPIEAKRDPRLKESGDLTGFQFLNTKWPLMPQTAFYNWIYIAALMQNANLIADMIRFEAFTDIEFNPEKSINCQAYAAALYVSLRRRGLIDFSMLNEMAFLKCVVGYSSNEAKRKSKKKVRENRQGSLL